MATQRKIVFTNDGYYHVFNRGLDRRPTFTNKREHTRAKELLYFYQFASIPIRFSRFSLLTFEQQQTNLNKMVASGKIVEVVAYCLMPNHFHLLLKQKQENGISTFTSNFINAYTKYFNTKHERTGSLFQGTFKAVYIETDEQLMHVTRYIHLNPIASSLIKLEDLTTYPWSSYSSYLSSDTDIILEEQEIQQVISMIPDYKTFVADQIDYAKKLALIKHLIIE